MTTILKATSKGQITIPINWRKEFNTDKFIATKDNDKIIIRPLFIDKSINHKKEISLKDIIREEDESGVLGDIIFDADRDNNGEGIEAGDFLKILKN